MIALRLLTTILCCALIGAALSLGAIMAVADAIELDRKADRLLAEGCDLLATEAPKFCGGAQ